MNKNNNYPKVKKREKVFEFHGQKIVDNYEWLRDKESKEVLDFLNKQNELVEEKTKELKPLKNEIFNEIKSKINETDLSVPNKIDDYWYFSRTEESKSYPIHCRIPYVKSTDGLPPKVSEGKFENEEVILDENILAKGKDFFNLGSLSVSKDGKQIFYSVDILGDEQYSIYKKNIDSSEKSDLIVENTSGSIIVSPNNKYLFYTTVDESWRPDKLWCHYLNEKTPDNLIFHEKDDSYWLSFGMSRSEKYYFLSLSSKITSEVYYMNVDNETFDFKLIEKRNKGVEYHVEHAIIDSKNIFFLVTNENALNFKIDYSYLDVNDDVIGFTNYIAEKDNVRIETIDAFEKFLVLSYRKDALNSFSVAPLKDIKSFKEIEKHSELSSSEITGNLNWDTDYIRYVTFSYIIPPTLNAFFPSENKIVLLKQQEVLGGYEPSDYLEQRIWVTSRDNIKIPVSLVKRKDTENEAPTLQYGYGSYEVSLDPSFSVSRLSLLDRGFVYVEAHIRGGGEMGRNWYEKGKSLFKWNTFNDFIDVSKYLIENKITSAHKLVASGGSAGGLLMGAVANNAPELYKGILAQVPFVDPLTSITDPTLPLTVIEWDEWGNPLESEAVFNYMKSYSPYQNVDKKNYPNILAMTSLNDTRVLYVEPAKWIAKLQELNPEGNLFLLKTEMVAGHGGVSGRYAQWEETAFELAWIISQASSIG